MGSEEKKFGGPRELTGAVDLISRYKLLAHHDFFCKRSLPFALSDAHYLHNLVGDTDIRKGEGMQLDELVPKSSYAGETNSHIQPFALDVLRDAFQLQETAHVQLPPDEKGVPTIASKSRSESKDKEKKHKKHRDKEKRKDKEHKKSKHRHKDRSKDKDKEKDKNGHLDPGDQSKIRQEKKRKHDGDESLNGHTKSKHKSSRLDAVNVTRVLR
ncbi:PREDICTED: mediator of RNA polymerase II transcription subunit 19a-like [Tarenaya hassleriana]|uniref:mediator of RNA polymerase II transcription subunit 19a-like n=1 Tax=Tarenaya hassleriana TaxID=28532 RepID=UPI00053C8800|nr:PREDICTED: mediator of RNA polymerase II transcription subunit 19a-like [Tarenaya hassleriana]XP_010557461.1 PREDICTED: mediator of RNA polymerase II transcription subunit 19a-like [Tarenaya hassleriana]